jgi:transposase
MDLTQLISSTLGISSPWQIKNLVFASDGRRLDITVEYYVDSAQVCPHCGARGAICEEASETWFHRDFFRFATYLHTRVPQINCCGRHHDVERPWTRAGSKFVQLDSPTAIPQA